jgi:hypothetical protein
MALRFALDAKSTLRHGKYIPEFIDSPIHKIDGG